MAQISGFFGSALTSIDPKGRMAIPASFRNPIIYGSKGDSVVMFSFNAEAQCLQGSGTERVNALVEHMQRRELTAFENGENFRTEVVGGPRFTSTFPVTFDGSGRLILPRMLVALAKIEKQVFFAGNGSDFSVWGVEHLLGLDDPQLSTQQYNAQFLMDELGAKR
ncbi:division/cell wall cluster transcriptional repressor MraZ [Blastomonas sp.]|uniref:division/cell wall cluster transcriptional repressor MraZ n=1 Tax=Blastomonas sp. TaxID=1909299 RepID=UPI0035933409